MRSGNSLRIEFCRFVIGAFALSLMLVIAMRAPAAPFPGSLQHTIHYQGPHANQPCLDSATFDSTVPQAAFSLALLPQATGQVLHFSPTSYSPSHSEFHLYNRPPPLL